MTSFPFSFPFIFIHSSPKGGIELNELDELNRVEVSEVNE